MPDPLIPLETRLTQAWSLSVGFLHLLSLVSDFSKDAVFLAAIKLHNNSPYEHT